MMVVIQVFPYCSDSWAQAGAQGPTPGHGAQGAGKVEGSPAQRAGSTDPNTNETRDDPEITGPCNLKFPEDHGAHPEHRTEWWYYTGNLRSEDGERFGFQLTFFRSRMSPSGVEKSWPSPRSEWRTRQLYLAHAALSRVDAKQYHHAERMAREALGMAGASQTDGATDIFVRNWSLRLSADGHYLRAVADDFAFDLDLHAEKPPMMHGDAGYSLKGSTPERSSCYYSFTRLRASGTVSVKGKKVQVDGSAWMDHEFSSTPLEPGIVGWDWFSLQFSDNTELMIYLLRNRDGSFSPASSGTFVDASGNAVHLARDDFSVEALGDWKSPHSGAVYPARWRIVVPARALDFTVEPTLPDQEMRTPESTGVTYWEGSVSITGREHGQPVTGVGYVELTGYEKPFDAPM